MQASPNTRHIFGKLGDNPHLARIFSRFMPELTINASGNGKSSLPWPCKHTKRPDVFPVFLPFSGCRTRCVFCSQPAQTGTPSPAGSSGVRAILASAQEALAAANKKQPVELAFYGGTFTAQDRESLRFCLDFAQKMLRQGKILSFRCSTRPDSLDDAILAELIASGCTMIELGAQSFADEALLESRRGYTGATAEEAAFMVKKSGLQLGIQLMPGMPGQNDASFSEDVARAIELGADSLRFYPCQVLEGTALAALWRRGDYRPWPLRVALRRLAQGLLLANMARVPVIRMGLAPQAGFNMLAGPWHPALGSMVQARALMLAALALARSQGRRTLAGALLHVPGNARGFATGHRKSLLALWQRLGLNLDNLKFDCSDEICLEYV